MHFICARYHFSVLYANRIARLSSGTPRRWRSRRGAFLGTPRAPRNRRRRRVTSFRKAAGLATGVARWRSLVLLHRAHGGEAQRARRGGFSPNATKERSARCVTFLRSERDKRGAFLGTPRAPRFRSGRSVSSFRDAASATSFLKASKVPDQV